MDNRFHSKHIDRCITGILCLKYIEYLPLNIIYLMAYYVIIFMETNIKILIFIRIKYYLVISYDLLIVYCILTKLIQSSKIWMHQKTYCNKGEIIQH